MAETEYRFTPEQMALAKKTSLTGLAAHYGFHPMRVGNLYTLKEHDSVRIYHDKTWCRFSRMGSRGEGGGSQIDFLMQFCGVSTIPEALETLLKFQGLSGERKEGGKAYPAPQEEARKEKAAFTLPEPAEGSYRCAYAYLMKTRGLSRRVVDYFIKDLKILYEDREHHNLVFLGKDKEGAVRYAAKRGTADLYGKKYRGDVAGNDKNYGVNIVNMHSDELKVFEAAIDLMSYLDLTGDYESSKLVLGMTADNPLIRFLKDYPHIKNIGFCLDNDGAGREAMFGRAADRQGGTDRPGLLEKYAALGYRTYSDAVPDESGCKDWNEYLLYRKQRTLQERPPEMEGRTPPVRRKSR